MSRLASTARGGDPARGLGDSIEEVRTRTRPPGRTSTPAVAARTVASSTAAMPRPVTTIPWPTSATVVPRRRAGARISTPIGDPVTRSSRLVAPGGLQDQALLHRPADLVAEQPDGVGAAVELDADAVAGHLVALHPVVAAAQVDPDADPVAADDVAAGQGVPRAEGHDPVALVALDQVVADGVPVGPLVEDDAVVAVGEGAVPAQPQARGWVGVGAKKFVVKPGVGGPAGGAPPVHPVGRGPVGAEVGEG